MIDKKFAPIESINSILEFGGGYGASEVVFRRRGFRGDHYVYDFPIMHLIREWYLSRNRGHTGFLTLPLTDIPEGLQTDVFVSVCSIDEAPVKLRNDFMDGFTSTFYLFIVTNVYDGVDNKVWCGQWLDDNNIAYRVIRLASGNQTMFIGERI
jgi:hypothetical protein